MEGYLGEHRNTDVFALAPGTCGKSTKVSSRNDDKRPMCIRVSLGQNNVGCTVGVKQTHHSSLHFSPFICRVPPRKQCFGRVDETCFWWLFSKAKDEKEGSNHSFSAQRAFDSPNKLTDEKKALSLSLNDCKET